MGFPIAIVSFKEGKAKVIAFFSLSIPISLVDKWRFDRKRWGGMGPRDHGRPGVGV